MTMTLEEAAMTLAIEVDIQHTQYATSGLAQTIADALTLALKKQHIIQEDEKEEGFYYVRPIYTDPKAKVMQAIEIEDNRIFRWQNDAYKILRHEYTTTKGRNLIVQRIGHFRDEMFIGVDGSHEEEFNPYCEVTPGKVFYTWEPDKPE